MWEMLLKEDTVPLLRGKYLQDFFAKIDPQVDSQNSFHQIPVAFLVFLVRF